MFSNQSDSTLGRGGNNHGKRRTVDPAVIESLATPTLDPRVEAARQAIASKYGFPVQEFVRRVCEPGCPFADEYKASLQP